MSFIYWLTIHMSPTTKLSEPMSEFWCGWQGLRCFNHHSLLPEVHISSRNSDLQWKSWDMCCRRFWTHLIALCPNAHPSLFVLRNNFSYPCLCSEILMYVKIVLIKPSLSLYPFILYQTTETRSSFVIILYTTFH